MEVDLSTHRKIRHNPFWLFAQRIQFIWFCPPGCIWCCCCFFPQVNSLALKNGATFGLCFGLLLFFRRQRCVSRSKLSAGISHFHSQFQRLHKNYTTNIIRCKEHTKVVKPLMTCIFHGTKNWINGRYFTKKNSIKILRFFKMHWALHVPRTKWKFVLKRVLRLVLNTEPNDITYKNAKSFSRNVCVDAHEYKKHYVVTLRFIQL